MNQQQIALIAAAALLPVVAFAQTPPAPPTAPVPPAAPAPPAPPPPPGNHHRAPKGPVTFLGVETSEVPNVVCDQLGLAKGFGLVVDYVVPDGPAAAGGVQQNDILKMLNEQILTEPDQLAKLVRSFTEGTTVTLTVLRKGAEQKLTVKLTKHEVSSDNHMFGPGMPGFQKLWESGDFGEMKERMRDLKEQLEGSAGQPGLIRDAVEKARVAVRASAEEARRAANEVRRQTREVRVVTNNNNGGVQTTRIDLGRAQILYSDSAGELKIETVDGKKILTAKDPQGHLLFSGPIETKEEIEKLPPEVRQRYQNLEQKELSSVGPLETSNSSDADEDNDNDDDDDEGGNSSSSAIEQVTNKPDLGAAVANPMLLL